MGERHKIELEVDKARRLCGCHLREKQVQSGGLDLQKGVLIDVYCCNVESTVCQLWVSTKIVGAVEGEQLVVNGREKTAPIKICLPRRECQNPWIGLGVNQHRIRRTRRKNIVHLQRLGSILPVRTIVS